MRGGRKKALKIEKGPGLLLKKVVRRRLEREKKKAKESFWQRSPRALIEKKKR